MREESVAHSAKIKQRKRIQYRCKPGCCACGEALSQLNARLSNRPAADTMHISTFCSFSVKLYQTSIGQTGPAFATCYWSSAGGDLRPHD